MATHVTNLTAITGTMDFSPNDGTTYQISTQQHGAFLATCDYAIKRMIDNANGTSENWMMVWSMAFDNLYNDHGPTPNIHQTKKVFNLTGNRSAGLENVMEALIKAFPELNDIVDYSFIANKRHTMQFNLIPQKVTEKVPVTPLKLVETNVEEENEQIVKEATVENLHGSKVILDSLSDFEDEVKDTTPIKGDESFGTLHNENDNDDERLGSDTTKDKSINSVTELLNMFVSRDEEFHKQVEEMTGAELKASHHVTELDFYLTQYREKEDHIREEIQRLNKIMESKTSAIDKISKSLEEKEKELKEFKSRMNFKLQAYRDMENAIGEHEKSVRSLQQK
jgi:hypothetical protein